MVMENRTEPNCKLELQLQMVGMFALKQSISEICCSLQEENILLMRLGLLFPSLEGSCNTLIGDGAKAFLHPSCPLLLLLR